LTSIDSFVVFDENGVETMQMIPVLINILLVRLRTKITHCVKIFEKDPLLHFNERKPRWRWNFEI